MRAFDEVLSRGSWTEPVMIVLKIKPHFTVCRPLGDIHRARLERSGGTASLVSKKGIFLTYQGVYEKPLGISNDFGAFYTSSEALVGFAESF